MGKIAYKTKRRQRNIYTRRSRVHYKKCPQYGDAVAYSSLKDDISKTVFNKFGYVRKGWSGLYVKHTVS